ncbi:PH domain-containing protein [Bacillus tianshenii]|uniref:PH domain-containing protein n=1 Tax=Sutcliffiella tianshenii TaxID=1463404 RepID=UPI001CD486FA|nr:PH domain-containing protein [Bacillus tianshenii]MCA1321548.1 PH domain-containing protein [Bacillus tianshenii]
MNDAHDVKRYHPAWIAVELITALKNSVFAIVFLFILKANSTSSWIVWGRYLFIAAAILTIFSVFMKWFMHRYELQASSIVVKEGILVKKQRTVAIERIQNHHSSTTFVHRWFNLTSLTLETGTSGDDAAITFPVITNLEKDRILSLLEEKGSAQVAENGENLEQKGRTVHFRSTRKDLFKASFTSLSFLAIFPLLSAVYFNLADFFDIEDSAGSAAEYLIGHWWMLIILFVIAMALSVAIGFFKTVIKYGNYEISDDEERIYIEKGVGSSSSFSIQKHKVQAIVVEQSILKRLLGLASIKLITVGSAEGEEKDTSSLYPFMPKHEAYELLHTLLPDYPIEENMSRFPLKVLWLKLVLPYYLTILTAAGLFFFKREWIWAAAIIFFLSVISRVLDYYFTSYIRHGDTVQVRRGGITNETFVTRRSQIQQITVRHSWIQRKFGVASLSFINRAKPMHTSELYGLSKDQASEFYRWYHRS